MLHGSKLTSQLFPFHVFRIPRFNQSKKLQIYVFFFSQSRKQTRKEQFDLECHINVRTIATDFVLIPN